MRPCTVLFLPIFTSLSAATTTTTSSVSPSPTLVPDEPVIFDAKFFTANANCNWTTGGVRVFIYGWGSCQNIAVPGTGSALLSWNQWPNNLTLTGWTETNCKGRAVPFGSTIRRCVPLNGTAIASWSDYLVN
ncbi:uncharacterized protein GGS22DRAFT_164528 [Annulohypoxylon maeteangense]|uniref:uncharacterized protein n=1 Tax=Annulohypoxylon maeteangense TaxID=1927788 RepID=UPI002008705F|nr:uncharacterized protein GGS22DRAFT_164528 [Annulohypoxylon maeteangense]KAI0884867.1 hypothetical protein GGS22DRAFT_164528 [Annulohypoxylon maeteangense]